MAQAEMPWFRFYSEAVHDAKVQRLPLALFKAWVGVLCLASENSPRGALPPLWKVAHVMRMSEERASQAIEALIEHHLLDKAKNGTWKVHNWHKRQYKSDNATARVQKHRAKRSTNGGGTGM